MPNLTPTSTPWTPAQTRAQYAAIAQLRWRILRNGLRRKGSTGDLVARILSYPILAAFALGPSIGVFLGAFYFATNGHLDRISWLLWGTFAFCQLLNIQLGQPGTTFDPTQLVRFPLRLSGYTAIRLFFGVLSPANVIGTLMAGCIALGVTGARPHLFLYAALGLAVFAAANVLFSRMVFAWVDRWLSTRRAREIFTAIGFLFAVGVQYLNFAFNPAYNRHHHGSSIAPERVLFFLNLYRRAHPFLQVLPPELTGRSLVAAANGRPLAFLALTLGCALFSVAFFAVFALRMKTEFRGESLSDAANATQGSGPKRQGLGFRGQGLESRTQNPRNSTLSSIPHPLSPRNSALSALIGKEFLYMRRNVGVLYSVVMPTVFVFLFAGRLAGRVSPQYVFPGAVAYTLLGILPLSFNSWGNEATGSQFYLLAPIRMRDVFLAKNFLSFALALLEMTAVFSIITYVSAMPSLHTALVALFWAGGTILLNTALGNRRSISSPKKIVSQRANKAASPLSTLLSLGILVLSAAIAATLLITATLWHFQGVLVPGFAVFFAAAAIIYWRSLHGLDRYVLDHREELFTELCKAA